MSFFYCPGIDHPPDAISLSAALTHMSNTDKDMLSFGLGADKMASRKRIGELAAAFAELLSGQDDQGADRSDGVFLVKDVIGARATGGAYRVLFERVGERLKRQLLDAFVEERWGPEARRLLRVLSQGQKLSESSVSLMSNAVWDRNKRDRSELI